MEICVPSILAKIIDVAAESEVGNNNATCFLL